MTTLTGGTEQPREAGRPIDLGVLTRGRPHTTCEAGRYLSEEVLAPGQLFSLERR